MKKVFTFMMAAVMMMMATSAMAQDVTTVFSENFDAFTEGSEESPATTDISSGYTNKLSSTLSGWSGRYVYEAGGMLKIGDGGNLQTARYDMKANGGIVKVSMRVRSLDEFGAMFAIALNYSDKVTDYVYDNEWHEVSYVVSGASTYSTTYIKVTASMAASGLLIDDLKVEQSAAFYPAPVAKQPTQADGTSFTARWATVSGSTGYYLDVYYRDNDGLPFYVVVNQFIQGSTTSTYKVTGLDPSQTYFFVVRATNGTATSANSNEIKVIKVVTQLDAPVALDATDVTEGGFTANWTEVEGADGYEISIAKVETLKEDQTVNVAHEDFAGITEGTIQQPGYPSLQEYLDNYTNEAGWYAYGHLYANGYLGLAPFSSNPATLTSPAKDLSASNGLFTVKAKMAATQYGQMIEGEVVTVNLYNGQEVVETKEVTLGKDFQEYTIEFTKGAEESYVEFSYPNTTNRVWIDEVTISQNKKAGDKVVSLRGTYNARNFPFAYVYAYLNEETSYIYWVRAYVETVIGGEIGNLYSDASNEIEVKLNNFTGVNDLNVEKQAKALKFIENGQVVIMKDGIKYNAAGQTIR